MGEACDQDPLIINRFFPEGLREAQNQMLNRFIADFVAGVETNLVFYTEGTLSSMERVVKGGWQNRDFSRVDELILQQAIQQTLMDGVHRIKLLNHDHGEKMTLVKDWMDYAETIFGHETHDMEYTRWRKNWQVWNFLGAAWDCMCFSRTTIFNPMMLRSR
jgi:hypothetical protein